MLDKKQRILNLLKNKKKPISTSQIASKISSNFWLAEKYLETLETEGSIKRIQQINSTYWELK